MDRRNNEIVQKQFYSHCIYHYRFHCRVYIAYRGMGEGIAVKKIAWLIIGILCWLCGGFLGIALLIKMGL